MSQLVGTEARPTAHWASPKSQEVRKPRAGTDSAERALQEQWSDVQRAYLRLALLWLLEGGGAVEAEDGRLASRLKMRFCLPDTGSVRVSTSLLFQRMDREGIISRTIKGRRTYAIKLLWDPFKEGREQLESQAAHLVKIVIGTSDTATPTEEQTPTHDVLIARKDKLEELAKRVTVLLGRYHAALKDAAARPGARKKGEDWYTLAVAPILEAAGFTTAEAAEARQYGKLVGIDSKGRANGNNWWWRVPENPPTLEAVRNVVVRDRKLATPPGYHNQRDAASSDSLYFPAHTRGTPTVLAPHHVGRVRLSTINGTNESLPSIETREDTAPEAEAKDPIAELLQVIAYLEGVVSSLKEGLQVARTENDTLTAKLDSAEGDKTVFLQEILDLKAAITALRGSIEPQVDAVITKYRHQGVLP